MGAKRLMWVEPDTAVRAERIAAEDGDLDAAIGEARHALLEVVGGAVDHVALRGIAAEPQLEFRVRVRRGEAREQERKGQ